MKINKYGKIDYKIGEVFKEYGVRLVAVESVACKDCFLMTKFVSLLLV